MPSAPLGQVSFVFTDIQGSSLLWERLPEAMAVALEQHDRIVRKALRSHRGYEVKTEGDAFMVAFGSPVDAVRFAIELQLALHIASWPEAINTHPSSLAQPGFHGLRVRVGVHAGEAAGRANPVTGIMDYHGPEVNRAARVCDAAHGGQILVSGTVWACVESEIEAVVTPLGSHELRGTGVWFDLLQVMPESLGSRCFPPPRTPRTQRTNLAPESDVFVGREEQVVEVLGALTDARLVTLLGPGGVGKTRLAQRVARGTLASGQEVGGVWFVDLSEADSQERIVERVAQTLQVPLTSPTHTFADHVEQLGRAIEGHDRMLLVLDNLEQVVEFAGDTVQRWLAQAPQLCVLATSRERLAISGERVYDLSPLSTEEAASLFCERASQVAPDVRFDPADEDIRALVTRLDGLPLAIELAAARSAILRPAQLRERLSERFRLLRSRRSSRPDRQATLRAVIDSSWQSLTDQQRSAMAQASLFRGGFCLEGAEATLDFSDFPDGDWTLDVLTDLVEKSLLRVEQPVGFPGERRYALLETIRAFAAEHLTGEARTGAIQRHALAHVTLAEQWVSGLHREGGIVRRRRLELETENLLAVWHRNALDAPELALRAVLALHNLLLVRGPFEHHLALLEKAIDVSSWASARHQATVWRARGRLLRRMGGAQAGREAFERAILLAEDAGDPRLLAQLTGNLGDVCVSEGRAHDARERYRDALRAFESMGDDLGRGFVLSNLGTVAMLLGEFDEAHRTLHTALALQRSVGDRRSEGLTLTNLGQLAAERRDLTLAETHFKEALAIHRELGDRGSQATVLVNLGNLDLERGGTESASDAYGMALVLARETGSRWSAALALGNRGVLRHFCGELEAAEADLHGAVERFHASGDRRGEGYFCLHAAAVSADALSHDDAAVLLSKGRELLEQLGDPVGAPLAALVEAHVALRRSPGPVTRREAERALGAAQVADAGSSWVERSADVRLAAELLRRSISTVTSAAC